MTGAGSMKRVSGWLHPWLLQIPAALLFGAVVLRSLLHYQSSPNLLQVMAPLAIWTALYASEGGLARRSPRLTHPYLAVQAAIALYLMAGLGLPRFDFFANLFVILSMQAMQRLSLRQGALWITLFSLLMALPLLGGYGVSEGFGFLLLYSAGNVLIGSYALATRRAQAARSANQDLAGKLEQANEELQAYASQLEQLAAARERHHLARELHDSVTQTVFSLTLAAQSALLQLEREPKRVPEQLDHVAQLAQETLAQMQRLIAELRPGEFPGEGLIPRLRRHLNERHLPQGLTVSVTAHGEGELTAEEEQGLFAIAREALNNVVKHACATQASIHLCLEDPTWMEVSDNGRGFDCPPPASGVGLPGMDERAQEIGWSLEIVSAPGQGTRIRTAKRAEGVLAS
jgi:signal transduction histidine kinase